MDLRVAAKLWFSFPGTSAKTLRRVTSYKTTSGVTCVDRSRRFSGTRWRAVILFIKWSCWCRRWAPVCCDFLQNKFQKHWLGCLQVSHKHKRERRLPYKSWCSRPSQEPVWQLAAGILSLYKWRVLWKRSFCTVVVYSMGSCKIIHFFIQLMWKHY